MTTQTQTTTAGADLIETLFTHFSPMLCTVCVCTCCCVLYVCAHVVVYCMCVHMLLCTVCVCTCCCVLHVCAHVVVYCMCVYMLLCTVCVCTDWMYLNAILTRRTINCRSRDWLRLKNYVSLFISRPLVL